MPNCTIRHPLAAAGGLAVALVLAACGNSSDSPKAPASASTSPAAATGTNRGPAAGGTIAAITGRTMQVQNQQSGQVAVTWTSTTAFSHEVQVSAAKIAVGSCVVASAATAASGSSAPASSSFTAARVVLSSASGGRCGGGVFPGGNRPAGGPTGARPSGLRTEFPSGGARPSGFPGGARNGSFAAGKVTARSGNALTVTLPAFGSSASSTTRTVLLVAATKVYEQARTTAKSLAVGRCVVAQGKADSSGTVSATRVQISLPTGGSRALGFGRVGNGG